MNRPEKKKLDDDEWKTLMKPTAFETKSRSQNTEEESHTHQLLMNREKRIENMEKDLGRC